MLVLLLLLQLVCCPKVLPNLGSRTRQSGDGRRWNQQTQSTNKTMLLLLLLLLLFLLLKKRREGNFASGKCFVSSSPAQKRRITEALSLASFLHSGPPAHDEHCCSEEVSPRLYAVGERASLHLHETQRPVQYPLDTTNTREGK